MDKKRSLGEKIVEKNEEAGNERWHVSSKSEKRQPTTPYIWGSDSPQLLHKDTHTVATFWGQLLNPMAVKYILNVFTI